MKVLEIYLVLDIYLVHCTELIDHSFCDAIESDSLVIIFHTYPMNNIACPLGDVHVSMVDW